MDFNTLIWIKVKENLQIHVLKEQQPRNTLKKLYPILPEDMHIDLQEVKQWSQQNLLIYNELLENGYSEQICNKDYISKIYTQLILMKENLQTLDQELLRFTNLTILNLNKNMLKEIRNIPTNVQELYLYQNNVHKFDEKLRLKNLLYLGLGYNNMRDHQLEYFHRMFPELISLDLSYNRLCNLEDTIENLVDCKNLKILNLLGNPICLKKNYFNQCKNELKFLSYLDRQNLEQLEEQNQQKENQQENTQKDQLQQQAIEDMENDAQEYQDNRIITKMHFEIQTFENINGVQLETPAEQKPEDFQSMYWLTCDSPQFVLNTQETPLQFSKHNMSAQNIPYLNFECVQDYNLTISPELRDEIREGIIVKVHVRQPKMEFDEETQQKKPVFIPDTETPEIEEKVLGITMINLSDWLSRPFESQNLCKKYYLFPEEVLQCPQFFVPDDGEDIKAAKIIEKENEEEQKNKQQEDTTNQAGKGGKKETKAAKKDDKKDKKGGKGDVKEEVQVVMVDWPENSRQNVYVNESRVIRSIGTKIAIKVEIIDI